MVIALVFSGLILLCGLAVNRALRAPMSLSPFTGLASIAVLATGCAAAGAPPWVSTGLLVALALAGLASTLSADGRTSLASIARSDRVTLAIVLASAAIPWLLLGGALASLDTPVSTHDGAFHVERVDDLRRGVPIQSWYPLAFHASVAAVLRLTPWLDSARGTVEAAQALAVLAPVGVFCLGLAFGVRPRAASLGGLVLALTYIYPYDDHMWAGWPLAASMLLLVGLWSVAAQWIARPRAGLAALAGLLAGAIVLAHGTEVYSSVIGLAVIAALNWRHLRSRALAQHVPLAVVAASICVLPYLSALLGWAAGGGASSAGAVALQDATAQAQANSADDWLQFLLGFIGAASLIDWPVRAVLLVAGARSPRMRVILAGWVIFVALYFAVTFLDLPAVRWLFVVTFPWLVQHRPPQVVVPFASLLVGSGLVAATSWLLNLRPKLAAHPNAFRRLAVVGAAVLLFVAEGSAVSIFKTLQQVILEQNVYLSDDRAAMAWLRQHAQPGEMLVNDLASDAGIWAPYKAGVPVLLPRSAPEPLQDERAPILTHVLDLGQSTGTAAVACGLHADYLYRGSRTVPDDARLALDRAALEQAPDLEQVFTSGDTAIFRIRLPCR
jgi:hypothetical protein